MFYEVWGWWLGWAGSFLGHFRWWLIVERTKVFIMQCTNEDMMEWEWWENYPYLYILSNQLCESIGAFNFLNLFVAYDWYIYYASNYPLWTSPTLKSIFSRCFNWLDQSVNQLAGPFSSYFLLGFVCCTPAWTYLYLLL